MRIQAAASRLDTLLTVSTPQSVTIGSQTFLVRCYRERPFQQAYLANGVRFNELGEWATPQVLMIQFQNIQGPGLDQYQQPGKQVILYPPQYKDGDLMAPFAK